MKILSVITHSHVDPTRFIFEKQEHTGPASFDPLRSLYRSDPALRFNKKYLNLCSEVERKSWVGST